MWPVKLIKQQLKSTQHGQNIERLWNWLLCNCNVCECIKWIMRSVYCNWYGEFPESSEFSTSLIGNSLSRNSVKSILFSPTKIHIVNFCGEFPTKFCIWNKGVIIIIINEFISYTLQFLYIYICVDICSTFGLV